MNIKQLRERCKRAAPSEFYVIASNVLPRCFDEIDRLKKVISEYNIIARKYDLLCEEKEVLAHKYDLLCEEKEMKSNPVKPLIPQMSQREGNISICRVDSNTRANFISIEIRDNHFHHVLHVEISTEAFALALTGKSCMPCLIDEVRK